MPEVPHIGLGLAGGAARAHDSKAHTSHNGASSILERPVRDLVEISATAHRLERLADAKDVRIELVERIRQQIAEGTYESEQRLADATDRLLQELNE